MVGEAAGQRLGQPGGLRAQRAAGQAGQHRRIPFAGDQRGQNRPPGDPERIGDHGGQLDQGVCAPRGADVRVEVRDRHPLTLSWQGGEAEGSPLRKVPGWVGAALTKPERASTARWFGFGERDGKEYARNPRYYVSQVSTGRNLADMAGSGAQPVGRSLGPGGNNFWAGLDAPAGRSW